MPVPPSWIPNELRRYGVHTVAASGAGKSIFLGKHLIWHDWFIWGTPTFVFDTGGAINNFLHKLSTFERGTVEVGRQLLLKSDPAQNEFIQRLVDHPTLSKMGKILQQGLPEGMTIEEAVEKDRRRFCQLHWNRVRYINMAGMDDFVIPLRTYAVEGLCAIMRA